MGLFDFLKGKELVSKTSVVSDLLAKSTHHHPRAFYEHTTGVTTLGAVNFLIHVTGVINADLIIQKRKMQGGFGNHANFGVTVQQCVNQAAAEGPLCALFFIWNGPIIVGNGYATMVPDRAYHFVDAGQYTETYILHRSQIALSLVAIATEEENYATAHLLTDPISIHVGN